MSEAQKNGAGWRLMNGNCRCSGKWKFFALFLGSGRKAMIRRKEDLEWTVISASTAFSGRYRTECSTNFHLRQEFRRHVWQIKAYNWFPNIINRWRHNRACYRRAGSWHWKCFHVGRHEINILKRQVYHIGVRITYLRAVVLLNHCQLNIVRINNTFEGCHHTQHSRCWLKKCLGDEQSND